MMNNKTTRQKMYVVLAIIILFSTIITAAAGGATVWHSKGSAIVEGDLQVTGTLSGSNLTSGNTYTYNNLTGTLSLPYTNVTGTPSGKQPYSYLIGAFSNSTYYAVNGSTNQYVVEWTSNNDDNVFGNVTAANPASVYVKSGTYSAVLAIPAGCYFMAENGTTGLSYSSIGNGARIDEPTFNSQFKGYNSGSYTIATNSTFYLAFKADNTIWYSSTNYSSVIQNAINALDPNGGLITIGLGRFYQNNNVIIPSTMNSLTISGISAGHNPGHSTTIQLNATNISGFWVQTTAPSFIGVQDMLIYSADLAGTVGVKFTSGSSQDVFVRRCYLSHLAVGIIAGNNLWAQDNWIENCATAGIQTTTGVTADLYIAHNLFYNPNCPSIYFAGRCYWAKIEGNRDYGSKYWVEFDNTPLGNNHDIIFSGNTIMAETTAFYYLKQGRIYNMQIENDIYDGEGTSPAFWSLTSGFVLDNTTISGNTFSGITTLFNNMTGLTLKDNDGYNPLGVLANPVLGTTLSDQGTGAVANATTYTCVNSPKHLYISGGTVVTIDVNGVSTGLTSGAIHLTPKDTFAITWSAPPTIVVFGQ